MSFMKRYYQNLSIEVIDWREEDMIRTSTESDPFDDNYQDPNLKNSSFSS